MGWMQHNFDMHDSVHVCACPDLKHATVGSVWECDDCLREWKITECEVVTWGQGDRLGTRSMEKRWVGTVVMDSRLRF